MSRLEFMKELARLLDDLPREEKIEILKYYNGYFDDAGVENEAGIIEELGSPEKVAAEVKAGMQEELIGDGHRETDSVTQSAEGLGRGARGALHEMPGSKRTGRYEGCGQEGTEQENSGQEDTASHGSAAGCDSQRQPRRQNSGGGFRAIAIVAIVAILMPTFPMWIGLLGGLIGLLGGSIGILVALVVGLFGAIIGLVGAAVGCMVGGISTMLTAPISGMLSFAVGIFLLGLMMVVGLLLGLVVGKVIPLLVGGIGNLIRWFGKVIGGIVDGVTGRR